MRNRGFLCTSPSVFPKQRNPLLTVKKLLDRRTDNFRIKLEWPFLTWADTRLALAQQSVWLMSLVKLPHSLAFHKRSNFI